MISIHKDDDGMLPNCYCGHTKKQHSSWAGWKCRKCKACNGWYSPENMDYMIKRSQEVVSSLDELEIELEEKMLRDAESENI